MDPTDGLIIPVAEVVPEDWLVLSAGAGIPADCRQLEERESVHQAALTGESFPVSRHPVVDSFLVALALGARRMAARRVIVKRLSSIENFGSLSVLCSVKTGTLTESRAVLLAGIRAGRRSFANTLNYIFIVTSANFGNMVPMAVASLALPFLPLLPKQILLTNRPTDLAEMTITAHRVDPDWMSSPHRWSIPFIQRFMVTFALVSSLFDVLTVLVLLPILHAEAAQFRSGWFLESVLSIASIVLVIRTRGPLPLVFLLPLLLILLAYLASAELATGWFHRRWAS
jgi:magnesium-transporting ATPase (P-type)